MIHSFDTEIAKEVGINAAIILNNIYFWVDKNRANEVHFHDGYYWTYNSTKAFQDLFPYMTEGQIRTAIDKLISSGFIIKGNYNNNPYDRTCWYAVTEQSHSFYRTNGVVPQNKSISNAEQMKNTYINTNAKNTNNKTSANAQPAKLFNAKKEEPVKTSKSDKWIVGKEKILLEYNFSDNVLLQLGIFLESLAEMNALISDITFRAQLNKLYENIKDDSTRLTIIKSTISRGWKSLDYAIEESTKSKHPSFDTSKPGSFQPKDPNNDERWKQYENQESF